MSFLDEATRELLKNRDPGFLKTVFSDVNPYLLKMLAANRVVGLEAQDIIQDSWQTFFSTLEKFEGRSQIKVFLGGILLNKMREHRRLQARFVNYGTEENPDDVIARSFTKDGWWNAEPASPDQLIESRETLDFINECLEGLSHAQKSAFILREVESENTESICKILEVSVTHLGVLIFRAKEKLRSCLEGKIGARSS